MIFIPLMAVRKELSVSGIFYAEIAKGLCFFVNNLLYIFLYHVPLGIDTGNGFGTDLK